MPSSACKIAVTGDHGEALGDHGEMTHGLFAYESTLHVPLIVAELGADVRAVRLQADPVVSDAPVCHVDIVPTILDALAMPVPPELSGHSLRTVADRDAGASRASYFEAMESMLDFGFAPLDGVMVGREKYINLPLPELYDLSRDRGETSNLAASSSERVRALSARLGDFHPTRPGAQQAESAEVAARLKALGYVTGSAAPKDRYTDRDDPKRLVEIDRLIHEAVALDEEGKLQEGISRYRQILAQ